MGGIVLLVACKACWTMQQGSHSSSFNIGATSSRIRSRSPAWFPCIDEGHLHMDCANWILIAGCSFPETPTGKPAPKSATRTGRPGAQPRPPLQLHAACSAGGCWARSCTHAALRSRRPARGDTCSAARNPQACAAPQNQFTERGICLKKRHGHCRDWCTHNRTRLMLPYLLLVVQWIWMPTLRSCSSTARPKDMVRDGPPAVSQERRLAARGLLYAYLHLEI